jgi:hypothetical protein
MDTKPSNEQGLNGLPVEPQTALGLAVGRAAPAAARRPNEGGTADEQPPLNADQTSAGAPVTNRAPSKCNPLFIPLRLGVDSLYTSYKGNLDPNMDERLSLLKKKAQGREDLDQALAQLPLGKHLFEVLDRGAKRFPYILVDNCFRIQVSSTHAKLLPLAYVQISSEYLAAVGVEEAELGLRFCIDSLGVVEGEASVARVDLFVDFITPYDFDAVQVSEWITRVEGKVKYYQHDALSGWAFGQGGDISARLYDKTLEIKKSKKLWLHELWQAAGWQPEQKVWRLEFQIKREALKELGIRTVPELVARRHNLWQYLCEDFLRLAIPSDTDQTRSRWPNHALWDAVGACFLIEGLNSGKLSRFSPTRVPSDERLFVHSFGGLTSFMAREGITDHSEAIGEYLHQATNFHRSKGEGGLVGYLFRKAAVKAKRFNTVKNRIRDEDLDALNDKAAAAYRKGKEESDG